MKFRVAEYADEVTPAYIKKALEFGYKGNEYTEKFSDKLVRVLHSDYHRKAKNLSWLLTDDSGRVRNYIHVETPIEEAFATAKQDSIINDIINELETRGATFTAGSFFQNRCTYQKQIVKISDLLLEPVTPVAYNVDRIANSRVFRSDGTEVPKRRIRDPKPFGLIMAENGFITDCLLAEELSLTPLSTFSGTSKEALADTIVKAKAGSLIVSMDLTDMITCSTGSCSSCMGVNKEHSAAAIMNFRTEFSLIAFTHDNKDRHIKTGRSWLFVQATERGFVRDLPFFKQQKAYGRVNRAHQVHLNSWLVKEIEKLTGKTLSATSHSHNSFWVSTNMDHRNSRVEGHMSNSGYFDTETGGACAYHFPKGVQDKEIASRLLLPFKDMLDLQGNPSNITGFHRAEGIKRNFGAKDDAYYDVLCSASRTIVLDCDAVEVSEGVWIRKDLLVAQLATKGLVAPTQPVETTVTPLVPEEALDDIEVDDF